MRKKTFSLNGHTDFLVNEYRSSTLLNYTKLLHESSHNVWNEWDDYIMSKLQELHMKGPTMNVGKLCFFQICVTVYFLI